MPNIYFTSDFHFGHTNILTFCSERIIQTGQIYSDVIIYPKASTDVMDEWLAKLWNTTVKKNDTVYFLGDLSFHPWDKTRQILSSLKGHKILIKGNHDEEADDNYLQYFDDIFDICQRKFTHDDCKLIPQDEPFNVVMCHYPMLSWKDIEKGAIMIHGHKHGLIDDFNANSNDLRVDVGIDGKLAEYELIPLEKLYKWSIN